MRAGLAWVRPAEGAHSGLQCRRVESEVIADALPLPGITAELAAIHNGGAGTPEAGRIDH